MPTMLDSIVPICSVTYQMDLDEFRCGVEARYMGASAVEHGLPDDKSRH